MQGVGGFAGALLTGVFAQKALNGAGADGALFGNLSQLAMQAIACVATGVYAAVVTFVILKLIDAAIGLRVPDVAGSRRPRGARPRVAPRAVARGRGVTRAGTRRGPGYLTTRSGTGA